MTIKIPALNSEFLFKGLDDPEKIKSIAKISSVWIEEASELTKDDFLQLDLRLRDRVKSYHQIILTFNPISAEHWLKKHFFDSNLTDCYILHTTYKDNRFLSEQYIQKLEHLKEIDLQYYKIYCLGEWGLLKGQIFNNFEIKSLKHLINKTNVVRFGLDFGFTNDPTAYIHCGINKAKKEIYIFDEYYKTGMTNKNIADYLNPILGRNLVTCDGAEPKSIKELKEHGLNAHGAKKGRDSVGHGIQFLQQHKIFIDTSCIEFHKEMQLYKWSENRKTGKLLNDPVDEFNHGIDALRYALERDMLENRARATNKLM